MTRPTRSHLVIVGLFICLSGYIASVTSYDPNLGVWMTELGDELRKKPIYSLAIPGSHNSGTYFLDRSRPIAPDISNNGWVKALRFLPRRLVKKVILNWSKTQKYTLGDQLKMGIRYFDLRLAPASNHLKYRTFLDDPDSLDGMVELASDMGASPLKATQVSIDDLYIIHGLYGPPLKKCLEDIKLFLLENPSELVIVNIQRLIGFNPAITYRLVRYLEDYFSDQLLPVSYSRRHDLSLDLIARVNKSLILFLPSNFPFVSSLIWPSEKRLDNKWANTNSVKKLIPFLTNSITSRPMDTLFVSQAILTAGGSDVATGLTGSLETILVPKANRALEEWIKHSGGPNPLNIVAFDFVNWANWGITKSIIRKNWSQ